MNLDFADRVEFNFGEPPPAIPNGLEEKAREKAQELLARLNAYISAQSGDQMRLMTCFKDFLNINERKAYPWQSNIMIPTVYNAVRMTWARVLEALYGAPQLAKIAPFGMIQTGYMADLVELEFRARLADSAFNAALELGNTRSDLGASSLDALIFGRAWAKSGWVTEGRPDGQGGMVITAEYPKAIRCSPWNVFKDPYCGSNLSRSREIIEILELSDESIIALTRSGHLIPDALSKCPTSQGPQASVYRRQAFELRKLSQAQSNTGYREIAEHHFLWDPDGDGMPTPWVMYYSWPDGTLLGCREEEYDHGQFPYSLGAMFPCPDTGFGIGLAEALHAIQRSESDTVNQLQENVAAMNVRHIVLEGALDEVALSKSIPNGIIRTSDMNAHKMLQGQGMPADVWNFLSYWATKGQETSGVTPVTMAMKGASTAYATSALQSNSQQNMDVIATSISVSLLNPLFKQLFSNTQQFMDLSILVNMPVEGFEKQKAPVSRQDIQGLFRVEPFDMRLYSRKVQRAKDTMALLSQYVQLQMPANYKWLGQKIMEDLELYEPQKAFEGEIYNPAMASAQAKNSIGMQGMGAAAPGQGPPNPAQGVAGQWTPNEVEPSQGEPESMRTAIRPNPGGGMPNDLSGMFGGPQ